MKTASFVKVIHATKREKHAASLNNQFKQSSVDLRSRLAISSKYKRYQIKHQKC